MEFEWHDGGHGKEKMQRIFCVVLFLSIFLLLYFYDEDFSFLIFFPAVPPVTWEEGKNF